MNHVIYVYVAIGEDIAVRCSCGSIAKLVASQSITLAELNDIAHEHITKAEAA